MKDLRKLFSNRRNQVIGAVVLAGAIAIFVIGVNGNNATCSGDIDKVNATGEQLTSDPGAYKCKTVTLSGKVFNVDKDGGDTAWQVWTNSKDSKNNVILYYSGSSDISEDDYVKFTGQVGGVFDGKNAFNGDVSAPVIKVSSIQKASRDEVVEPALKTIMPNKSKTIQGVTVTLSKIEFAANETRLYIHVKNDSSATATIYDFDTKIVQSGSQVQTKYIFDSDDSSELPSDILAHTSEKGKMYFEKADSTNPLRVILQGMSEDDYQDLNYTFNIGSAKNNN